jgi:hypothetical protein
MARVQQAAQGAGIVGHRKLSQLFATLSPRPATRRRPPATFAAILYADRVRSPPPERPRPETM